MSKILIVEDEAAIRRVLSKILSEEDGRYTVKAEVFGDGIDMWIRSQGKMIEMLEER